MSISIRTIASFAVAALLGLLAVLVARYFIINAPQSGTQIGATGPLVNVVVAAQPIQRGAPIQSSMLKVVAYPAASAPVQVFHSVEEASGAQGQQRLALRSMVVNEPILSSNVSDPGGKLNLSTLVAPGMRAVSLRSNDVVGVGGFVLPGDRVDILLTRSVTVGGGQQTSLTQIVAENVRVLGVDQSDSDETNTPVVAKAVTVEVTPEQAESISLGESVGTVSLILRHVADDAPLTQKVLTVTDLSPVPIRRAKAGSGEGGVRVIRGVTSSHFNFAVGSGLHKMSTQVPAGVTTP